MRRRPRLLQGATIAGAVVATAFGGHPPFVTSTAASGADAHRVTVASPAMRTFLRVEWRKKVLIGGSLEGELLKPTLLASRGTTFYLFDYGDLSVRAYGATGTLLWRLGRQGHGPAEFDNPTDLKVDGRGQVWIADPANARVTVIDGRGRLVRTVSTTMKVERLLPLATGGFVGFGSIGRTMSFLRYDSLGQGPVALRHPVWMDTAPPLVSELRVARSPDNRTAAIGQFYSGRILLMQGPNAGVRDIPVVETQEFPKPITFSPQKGITITRIPKDARPLIRAITADSAFAYVLIAGSNKASGRIVDLYQLRDGSYRGSYLLPEEVEEITALKGGFAALVSEPMPAVYYFERIAPRS